MGNTIHFLHCNTGWFAWSWNEMRAKQAGGGGPLTYPLTQKNVCGDLLLLESTHTHTERDRKAEGATGGAASLRKTKQAKHRLVFVRAGWKTRIPSRAGGRGIHIPWI